MLTFASLPGYPPPPSPPTHLSSVGKPLGCVLWFHNATCVPPTSRVFRWGYVTLKRVIYFLYRASQGLCGGFTLTTTPSPITGHYWVDPNGGCVADAHEAFCDFHAKATCVNVNNTQVSEGCRDWPPGLARQNRASLTPGFWISEWKFLPVLPWFREPSKLVPEELWQRNDRRVYEATWAVALIPGLQQHEILPAGFSFFRVEQVAWIRLRNTTSRGSSSRAMLPGLLFRPRFHGRPSWYFRSSKHDVPTDMHDRRTSSVRTVQDGCTFILCYGFIWILLCIPMHISWHVVFDEL